MYRCDNWKCAEEKLFGWIEIISVAWVGGVAAEMWKIILRHALNYE